MVLMDLLDNLFSNARAVPCNKDDIALALLEASKRAATPYSDHNCMRGSSVGKPWIVQILDSWFPLPVEDEDYNLSRCQLLTSGFIAQVWAEKLLTQVGLSYVSEGLHTYKQGAVEIVGHADIVVSLAGQVVVLEVKAMAEHIYRSSRKEPNDDFGYVSQLSFYTRCVELANPSSNVKGAFLFFNRSACEYSLVPLSSKDYAQKWERINKASSIINSLAKHDYVSLLENVVIPEVVSEGKAIPTSVKFSRWGTVLYEYSPDTKRFSIRERGKIVKYLTELRLQGVRGVGRDRGVF
jgi:hypothetical protein